MPGIMLNSGNAAVYGRPTVFAGGTKSVTTAGTRVQLSTDNTHNYSGVYIRAKSTNTGLIYVGDVTVDNTKFFLTAADGWIFIPVYDLSTFWLDSSVNGEGIVFLPV